MHSNAWRDCLERLDEHQTGATRAAIEERKGRTFALQASDRASSRPLHPSFQIVSGRWILRTSPLRSSKKFVQDLAILGMVIRLYPRHVYRAVGKDT